MACPHLLEAIKVSLPTEELADFELFSESHCQTTALHAKPQSLKFIDFAGEIQKRGGFDLIGSPFGPLHHCVVYQIGWSNDKKE